MGEGQYEMIKVSCSLPVHYLLPSSLCDQVFLEVVVPLNAQSIPRRLCGLEDGLENPAEAKPPGPGRKRVSSAYQPRSP